MENASARNLWGDFLDAHLEFASEDAPKVMHFCDNEKDADECAELVLRGHKKATSPSLWGIEKRNESLPKKGDFNIVTDWSGKPVCVIETTSVVITQYDEISQQYAFEKGEGDKSLVYWKEVHWDYYQRELAEFGIEPSLTMPIVCEKFKVVKVF